MALQEFLNLQSRYNKLGLSEERVTAILPVVREYVAFWREYPDMFIDFLLEAGNPQNFHLYFYQRVFLRAAMRHKYVYAVYPRACADAPMQNLILLDKSL